jgi:hypothetical protein
MSAMLSENVRAIEFLDDGRWNRGVARTTAVQGDQLRAARRAAFSP